MKKILIGIVILIIILVSIEVMVFNKKEVINTSNLNKINLINFNNEVVDLTQELKKQKYTILLCLGEKMKYNANHINYIINNFTTSEMKIMFIWDSNNFTEKIDAYPFESMLNYKLEKNMMLDNDISEVIVLNEDNNVLFQSTNLDDAIDKLINYYSDKSYEVIDKLINMNYYKEFNSNSSKVLIEFSTTSCEMCENVLDVIDTNTFIKENYKGVIIIGENLNKDGSVSDPFNIYSRFFNVNMFPTIMEVDLLSKEYVINPEHFVEIME